jgi:hypothetical protein
MIKMKGLEGGDDDLTTYCPLLSQVTINGEEIRKEDVAIVDSTQLWNNACEHHSL